MLEPPKTPPDNTPTSPKPEASRRSPALLSAWMRDLIISLGISAFIIVFLYQPVKVEGTSMLPELVDQIAGGLFD